MPESQPRPVQALAQRFFDHYVELHPEEATTLGLKAGAERLRDHSPQGLAEEARWYAAISEELAALGSADLSPDERLDVSCIQRLVDYEISAQPWLYATIDWSLYPYNILEIQQLHAETELEHSALRRRAAQVPRFLEQQAERVDQAIRDGVRVPDRSFRDFLVSVQLPAAVAALRRQGHQAAAVAYEAHIAWMREIRTCDAASIGEPELRHRLLHMLGVQDEPAKLIADARADLAEIHELLIRASAEVAPGRGITTLSGVRELTQELQVATLADQGVVDFYAEYVVRAKRLVVEQQLFALPADYVMGIDILPESFAAASGAGNWPAPLLAPGKLGHFLVAADPAAHSVAWAADLAVHEGLPGHHLQSFLWQRRFGRESAPVRFLVVHDQVAIPRNYWAPMLNIEGWAVYAEELMRRAGFFTKTEELFVLLAHAVRASRVVCDLSLAAGEYTQAQVAQFLTHNACLTERHAALEARRYAQIPLQACTYHLGRRAIEDLASGWQDIAAFHDYFLSFGPVDPRAIKALSPAAAGG